MFVLAMQRCSDSGKYRRLMAQTLFQSFRQAGNRRRIFSFEPFGQFLQPRHAAPGIQPLSSVVPSLVRPTV